MSYPGQDRQRSRKEAIKRHRQLKRDIVRCTVKRAYRRLARCGGAKLLSSLIAQEVLEVVKVFLQNALNDVIRGRSHMATVTALRVFYALKRRLDFLKSFGR